jgi:hypothetical protein
MVAAVGQAATKLRQRTPEERRRGPLRQKREPAPHRMDSLSEPRFCAMGAQCKQAPFLDGGPARLRSINKSQLCSRCEESGLSLRDVGVRYSLESAPSGGEENKVRAFKDGLLVQVCLQYGPFWDAI